MAITQTTFITEPGKEIKLFELKNSDGTSVKITNAGATITSIKTRDKNGSIDEITLGFNNPSVYLSDNYLANCPYLGTTAGRFANRIANGKFTVEGNEYILNVNNGKNHLHGGPKGFHSKIWGSEIKGDGDNQKLILSLLSHHMDEGYPGNLTVNISYHLTNQNELVTEYLASSDKATPVNITNHTYFNLNGLNENILKHDVKLFADNYTEKENDIPTGRIVSVKNTPFDFLEFHKIGERLNQLPTDAYDHNYVLNNGNEGILSRAAFVKEPTTGRTLEVFTTLPGMQFYIGYHLDGSYSNNDKKFEKFGGFCLETQYFPDSPNKPDFPNCITKPGNPFKHTTVFKFGVGE